MYELELRHHGIKGMRWGIRRYQNKDGSLTPAGKTNKQRKAKYSDDAKEVYRLKKKQIKSMTNAEIRKLIERQQLEQNYHRLNKSTIARGAAFVASVTALSNTIIGAYKTGKKVEKIFKKSGGK